MLPTTSREALNAIPHVQLAESFDVCDVSQYVARSIVTKAFSACRSPMMMVSWNMSPVGPSLLQSDGCQQTKHLQMSHAPIINLFEILSKIIIIVMYESAYHQLICLRTSVGSSGQVLVTRSQR